MFFSHDPRTIDRAGVIIRPKQPYVDWANSMDDDGPRAVLGELRTDPTIYLVDDVDFLEDFNLAIEENWSFNVRITPDVINWEWIFKEQLCSWMRDPECWPADLTREMFNKWFDCELSTMIWDMLGARIKHVS